MELLKISPSNAKIGYESLSLLSGHSCPFALDCLAKVNLKTFKIIDGKDAQFRCFSATAEAAFPSVRRQRQHNFDLLRNCDTVDEMVELLTMSIRPSYAPLRIHVGGEFLISVISMLGLNTPNVTRQEFSTLTQNLYRIG